MTSEQNSAKSRIQKSIKEALKLKQAEKVATLRSLLSELQYLEMNGGASIKEEELISLVQREIKKRKESIEFAEKAERPEMVKELHSEIAILQEFLPEPLTEEELTETVHRFIEANPASRLPEIMKHLKDSFSGRFDGRRASEIVKKMTAT